MSGTLYRHKLVLKYILTGASASSIDLILLFIFKEFFGFWYLTSAVIALSISFSIAFIVQKYWTFGDYSENNIHGQFFWYFFTVITSIGVNLLILSTLVEFFRIHYIPAQAISLIIAGTVGFIMNLRNVFDRSKFGIVIAAGIFPPDVGGPATFASNLCDKLVAGGADASIVTYSDIGGYGDRGELYHIERISRSLPFGVRHLVYLFWLFLNTIDHELIYAQDVTAAGLPAVLVKKILRRRLVIRIGGDLLWERAAESGQTDKSMRDYYASGAYKGRLIYKIGKMVMSTADQVVVPAEFLREIYIKYYQISPEKIVVIKNPIPDLFSGFNFGETNHTIEGKTILFAGRFLKLKNIDRLIQAFSAIYPEIQPAKLILVGDGPEKKHIFEVIDKTSVRDRIEVIDIMPRSELFSSISKVDLCVCPSLSEVNSNFILECLALGKPVILTKDSGLSVKLPEEMLFSYDNQEELGRKIKALLGGYDKEKIRKIVMDESSKSSWSNVFAEYLRIFEI